MKNPRHERYKLNRAIDKTLAMAVENGFITLENGIYKITAKGLAERDRLDKLEAEKGNDDGNPRTME